MNRNSPLALNDPYGDLPGKNSEEKGAPAKEIPKLGIIDPSNAADRALNSLYGKGYLNDAFDFYTNNEKNIVSRIFLDGKVSIVTSSDEKIQLHEFTNDQELNVVENLFDLAADVFVSQFTDP